jgi:hypothetical protein
VRPEAASQQVRDDRTMNRQVVCFGEGQEIAEQSPRSQFRSARVIAWRGSRDT